MSVQLGRRAMGSSSPRACLAAAGGLLLSGWFVSSPFAATLGAVIVFNGNAANCACRAPLAAALRDYGYQVLLFDYRGYGRTGERRPNPV